MARDSSDSERGEPEPEQAPPHEPGPDHDAMEAIAAARQDHPMVAPAERAAAAAAPAAAAPGSPPPVLATEVLGGSRAADHRAAHDGGGGGGGDDEWERTFLLCGGVHLIDACAASCRVRPGVHCAQNVLVLTFACHHWTQDGDSVRNRGLVFHGAGIWRRSTHVRCCCHPSSCLWPRSIDRLCASRSAALVGLITAWMIVIVVAGMRCCASRRASAHGVTEAEAEAAAAAAAAAGSGARGWAMRCCMLHRHRPGPCQAKAAPCDQTSDG
jgi:hypothetical protein